MKTLANSFSRDRTKKSLEEPWHSRSGRFTWSVSNSRCPRIVITALIYQNVLAGKIFKTIHVSLCLSLNNNMDIADKIHQQLALCPCSVLHPNIPQLTTESSHILTWCLVDNVEHSIWDLDKNATWDASQKELFYASREGLHAPRMIMIVFFYI